MIRIYVGNLSYDSTETDLRNLFQPHGDVSSVHIVTDRETQRSRGFGFVEMQDRAAGKAAIDALTDTELGGRRLTVNEAKPRNDSLPGGRRERR